MKTSTVTDETLVPELSRLTSILRRNKRDTENADHGPDDATRAIAPRVNGITLSENVQPLRVLESPLTFEERLRNSAHLNVERVIDREQGDGEARIQDDRIQGCVQNSQEERLVELPKTSDATEAVVKVFLYQDEDSTRAYDGAQRRERKSFERVEGLKEYFGAWFVAR